MYLLGYLESSNTDRNDGVPWWSGNTAGPADVHSWVITMKKERNKKSPNMSLHQFITIINRNYLKTNHTNHFLPCWGGGGGNRSEINTDANCSQIRMLLVQRSVSLVWILKTRDVRKKGRRRLALGTALHHFTISKCYCVGFHFQHGNWRKNLERICVAVSSEPMLRLKVSLSVCAYI